MIYRHKIDSKGKIIDHFYWLEGYPPLFMGCGVQYPRKCYCGSHVSFNTDKIIFEDETSEMRNA